MKKKPLFPLISLVVVLLVATGCLGPKPIVESFTAAPPQPGSSDPFKIEAVVHNGGPGGGQVEVEVTLLNKENGQVLKKASNEVELQQDETQHVLFELNLPPSAEKLDPGSIEVQVDAHYPIE